MGLGIGVTQEVHASNCPACLMYIASQLMNLWALPPAPFSWPMIPRCPTRRQEHCNWPNAVLAGGVRPVTWCLVGAYIWYKPSTLKFFVPICRIMGLSLCLTHDRVDISQIYTHRSIYIYISTCIYRVFCTCKDCTQTYRVAWYALFLMNMAGMTFMAFLI